MTAIVQLKPTDPEYNDLQVIPEMWSSEPMHHMGRDCWCKPEIVEVPPRGRTATAINAGDGPYEVRHRDA